MTRSVPVLVGALLLGTLCGSAVAQTNKQSYEAQRKAAANRQRCVNGVLIGGVAGGALARGSLLNRLGGAAIGGTAGCVINRGVNEGRRAMMPTRCTSGCRGFSRMLRSTVMTADGTLNAALRLLVSHDDTSVWSEAGAGTEYQPSGSMVGSSTSVDRSSGSSMASR